MNLTTPLPCDLSWPLHWKVMILMTYICCARWTTMLYKRIFTNVLFYLSQYPIVFQYDEGGHDNIAHTAYWPFLIREWMVMMTKEKEIMAENWVNGLILDDDGGPDDADVVVDISKVIDWDWFWILMSLLETVTQLSRVINWVFIGTRFSDYTMPSLT